MVEQHGHQPGDPRLGAEAVVRAISSADPPRRLVLGGAAHDRVVEALEATLAELRAHEAVSRGVDFPVVISPA
jgi:hypothetical protein